MSTQTTGVIEVPDPAHGQILVRVMLRNYRSLCSRAKVTVNRFLCTGRKSQVLCREVSLPPAGVTVIDIPGLRGSIVEVLVKGAPHVKPTVVVVQSIKPEDKNVLITIGPRLFVSV